ncbi:hypothetical protein Aab01nite_31020 [Paractinoplanes abujensis]|uniref:DUF4240 domain-containing protein n=1 Tax=Paractinoplanes abujensis TaxID=882441 RepID=A0A7W7G6X0_9ACTN|nr:DUF4240 domain-containing protein [Actinoplanes abujensis]MBB4698004.1 hypothetical protein [Actinoplanes abujensis]GID19512.1 hypothetical protein Aab01nite_31020 [Actinoplanes abujensis]
MEPGDFWQLITLGDDREFGRVVDELARREVSAIYGFEDRLAALLYAIDTYPHARAARARGDWFLYVRCAVVADGPSAYEEVLAEPRKLRRYATREAEHLLSVASTAYERKTGLPWTHEAPYDYESGSNAEGWAGSEPPLWIRAAVGVARLLNRGGTSEPPGR